MTESTVNISWALLDDMVEKAVKMVYHDKFAPHRIAFNRMEDAVPAAMIACRSSAYMLESLNSLAITDRSRVLVVSVDNDPDILEDIVEANNRLARLYPLGRYELRTLCLFDRGFPVYDYSIHPIPFQVVLPYKVTGGRGADRTLPRPYPASPAAAPFNNGDKK